MKVQSKRHLVAVHFLAVSLVGACLLFAAPSLAQDRKPLLMEGKKTLYQRVLTRPGTKVLKDAQPDAAVAKDDLTPFTVFYVYGRKRAQNTAMIEVGATIESGPTGWIEAKQAIDWKQALTVAFTNPADRKRVLLLRDRPPLMEIIEAAEPAKKYGELYDAVTAGKPPANSPVVSIEPPEHVDIQQQFYLLPILEHQQALTKKGQPATALKIASVSLNDPPPPGADAVKPQDMLVGFKTGIVFVVDTTITMGPYIDRMRDVVARVYKRVEAEKLEGDVSFGLVAYRNSTKSVPDLEYTTRTFASLKEGVKGQNFLDLTSQVTPAKVSSGPQLPEDAYAGVMSALTEMDWDQYAAKIVVLISDASALEGNHPLASTGMFTSEVREFAQTAGIALFAVHLKTREGARDHAAAATQYEMLTRFQGKDSLYIPVEAGSVDRFGETIERLATAMTQQVKTIRQAMTEPAKKPAAPEPLPSADAGGIDRKAALVGNAMQLAYLGKRRGTQAPPVFEAWVSDRDFDRPTLATLDVRLLMSRDQISDLQQVLKTIIKAGEAAQISPEGFFTDLQSAAAAMARTPRGVAGVTKSAGGAKNLAETGLIGEYLDGLPYKSDVLNISQDLWQSWSIGEQQAFIDRLKSKIRFYEELHNNTDSWVALDGGSLSGESVYPVPLDALP